MLHKVKRLGDSGTSSHHLHNHIHTERHVNKVWLLLSWLVKNHVVLCSALRRWSTSVRFIIYVAFYLISLNINKLFHHFSPALWMKKLSKLSKPWFTFISAVEQARALSRIMLSCHCIYYSCIHVICAWRRTEDMPVLKYSTMSTGPWCVQLCVCVCVCVRAQWRVNIVVWNTVLTLST